MAYGGRDTADVAFPKAERIPFRGTQDGTAFIDQKYLMKGIAALRHTEIGVMTAFDKGDSPVWKFNRDGVLMEHCKQWDRYSEQAEQNKAKHGLPCSPPICPKPLPDW